MIYLKKAFSYLAILNLFDGAITFFGLRYSLINEGNPLMNDLYEADPLFFLGYKVLLSGFLYILIRFNNLPTTRLVKVLTTVASALYTAVIVLHCVWVTPIFLSLFTSRF